MMPMGRKLCRFRSKTRYGCLRRWHLVLATEAVTINLRLFLDYKWYLQDRFDFLIFMMTVWRPSAGSRAVVQRLITSNAY